MVTGRPSQTVTLVALLLAVPLAAPLAEASHDRTYAYYSYINSGVSDATLAPGQSFTHTVSYKQTFTGYTTLSGYLCCWGRQWTAGPFHAASGVLKTVNVGMNAPSTPGNYDLWGFAVSALTAYPSPTYRNAETHADITVVGNPTTPCVSESHTGGGWSTHDSPLWTWGCSSAAYGSIVKWEVDVSWGGTFETTSTSYHPTLGTGAHWIAVRALNNVGRWSAWSAARHAYVDVTPPNAPRLAESHVGEGWSNHAHPAFAWTNPGDAGSGVARYVGTLDGASVSLGGATSWHPTLDDGEHAFSVRAVDGVGLAGPASNALTVRIDTAPPTSALEIGAPSYRDATGTWVTSHTPFALDATDRHCGVARVERALDDGPFEPVEGPFTLGLADGPHTLATRAADCAGNVEAAHALALRLDSTPPRVALARPEPGVVYAQDTEVARSRGTPAADAAPTVVLGNLTVVADASDAGVGLARVEFLVDGEVAFVDTSPPYAFVWRTADLVLGPHTLAVRAVDRLNHAALAEANVTVVPTGVAGVLATIEALTEGDLPDVGPLPDPLGLVPDPDDLVPDPGDLVPDLDDLPDPRKLVPPLGPFPPSVQPRVSVVTDPQSRTVTYTIGVVVNGTFHGVSGTIPPGA